jgi:hypothetical protein
VSDEQLIAAVQKAISQTDGPVASTKDIAAISGISGQRVRDRVEAIDEIKSKNVGGAGPRIYWPSDES